MSHVGKRLREERDRKRLTQVQVFKRTGINNKTLSGYENDVSHPDLESLRVLANLYGVTTDYLLGEDKKIHIEETEIDKDRKMALDLLDKIKGEKKLRLALALLEQLAEE